MSETMNLQQELDRVKAERDVYLKALHWYAHPDQWETLKDDRGRDTLVWRWGDDGGEVARRALRVAGASEPAADAWDSSQHEPADEPSWMAGVSRIE